MLMGTAFVPTPTTRCGFGIARCNVTPPVGIYNRMWGAALTDQATGIHRPLTATAMAIQPADCTNPAQRQIIIAVDHVFFRPKEMHEILERTSALTGIPEEQILIAFSHTHSAGLLVRERCNMPGGDLIGPYLDELPSKLAMACLTAVATIHPAVMTYATTHCRMGRHRDFWDEVSGQFVCGFNPDGEIDDSLVAIRVTDACQRTVATIVNYGCHPTTLAWENTLISPDYIGAMREVVELATNAPCAFLLSPCGDVGPMDGFTGDVRVADRNGRQVGHQVLSALESLPAPELDFHFAGAVISGATIGSWKHRPQTPERLVATKRFEYCHEPIDLDYLDSLPTLAQAEQLYADLHEQEQQAKTAGDEQRLRDVRALCERARRQLDRMRPLPAHTHYPLSVWLWRMGDALWVALEGEPYNAIQAWLRKRFTGRPVVITVMVNGARNCYMPTREAYEKNLYQVEVALLAPGCLEETAQVIERRLAEWLKD
jgi:hypothetical protein